MKTALTLLLCIALAYAAIPRFVEVSIETGTVKGLDDGAIARFLGIPFAAPPRGSLRWAPPKPANNFAGVLDCTAYRSGCMQPPHSLFDIKHMSEDCLFLNVFAPSILGRQFGLEPELKPVMVFIHGGAFTNGAAVEIKYNGTQMVLNQDVVFVSMNYRLGTFGFLAQDSFLNEDPSNPTAGLYGIQDQQMALQWVQDNIAQFGGDPSRVTVFGESAGGMSICIHLAMPSSAGLFQNAIIESGICSGFIKLENGLERGNTYAEALLCDPTRPASEVRDCMRSKSAADALAHQTNYPDIGPVVDGHVLPQQPNAALKAGESNKVPLVIGTNKDEGLLFIGLKWSMNLTSQEYKDILVSIVGPIPANLIYAMYSPRSYGSAVDAFSNLITDMIFNCPSQTTAAYSAQLGMPTFVYEFEHEPSYAPGGGAFHGAEIPFVFGYPHAEGAEFTPEEQQLSAVMQGYWATFAKSGDPGEGWPAFDDEQKTILDLDLTPQVLSGYREEMCLFWETTYDLIRDAINNGDMAKFVDAVQVSEQH